MRCRAVVAGLWLVLCGASLVLAQAPKAAVPGQKTGPAAKIPEPEPVNFETKDGVNIKATYYAGTPKKETIPIIMIHGWEGQRGEYDTLAKGLQQLGHAVIVPDLRGHGQSTTQKLADGTSRTLEADKLRPAELDSMVWDIEACKKFLMEKNNLGELNINSLCVVGSDFGSILALRWAALDLTAPPLLAYKQGQDVKALVLLSPLQAFKGLTIRDALAVPAVRRELSMMIVAGQQDAKGLSEAKRLHSSLVTSHPKVDPNDAADVQKNHDLFLVQPDTKLQGTKLLGSGLPVMQNIGRFIELRLVNKRSDFPWTDRKRSD